MGFVIHRAEPVCVGIPVTVLTLLPLGQMKSLAGKRHGKFTQFNVTTCNFRMVANLFLIL